jgi:predicted CXXCH cytochrome family protein
MKRLVLIVLGALLFAAPTMAQQITGTAHDLRTDTGSTRICAHCHTPHSGSPSVPLWNHTLSLTGAAGYSYYDSTTMVPAAQADQDASTGITGLCMSCHDGTVALGNLQNPPQSGAPTDTTSTILTTDAGYLGVDLTNDHPVGFDYTLTTASDSDFNSAATLTGTVELFAGDRVECASCHDVHDNTFAPFLVEANVGSTMCLQCHVK